MAHLQSQKILKGLLEKYYTGMAAPLAWCTSAGPAEILRALGFEVYFPENHGALLGATRTAQRYIPRAHQAGYAGEICSYLTSDIGAHLMGETPLSQAYGLKSVPRPDLIVFNTNQCREVAEWFQFYGREFHCPVVGIYPPRYLEEVSTGDIDHVVQQFKGLIATGEVVTGRTLDPEVLVETVRLSHSATQLWKKALQTACHRPAPLTFFDGTILMAPIVVLRGSTVCVDFYRHLVNELEQRMQKGVAAVPSERVRIYWEGMPVWGRLRFLADIFRENGAAVVASTYCSSWVFEHFDIADPLASMARAYLQIFINRSENAKLGMLQDWLQEYQVDGVVFHDSRTCFNNANSRFGLPARVAAATGLDTLVLDGDLVDLRFFSDGQARTQLETFIEQVAFKTPAGEGVD